MKREEMIAAIERALDDCGLTFMKPLEALGQVDATDVATIAVNAIVEMIQADAAEMLEVAEDIFYGKVDQGGYETLRSIAKEWTG